MTIDELVENFELLGEWEQRYEYLTDLGKRLGTLPDADKTDMTKVHGCMSNVYIVGDPDPQADDVIRYRAECDTPIISGVIAVLLLLYSGKSPRDVLTISADEFFERIRLFDHLSPMRHVGVYAIVERLRAVARERADTLTG